MRKGELIAEMARIRQIINDLETEREFAAKLNFNTQCSAISDKIRVAEEIYDNFKKYL